MRTKQIRSVTIDLGAASASKTRKTEEVKIAITLT